MRFHLKDFLHESNLDYLENTLLLHNEKDTLNNELKLT
jgi:hypothetical protein